LKGEIDANFGFFDSFDATDPKVQLLVCLLSVFFISSLFFGFGLKVKASALIGWCSCSVWNFFTMARLRWGNWIIYFYLFVFLEVFDV
jgi:hypothetical protein